MTTGSDRVFLQGSYKLDISCIACTRKFPWILVGLECDQGILIDVLISLLYQS